MFNKKSKYELRRQLEQETFKRITCSFYRYCEINNPEKLRHSLYQDLSDLVSSVRESNAKIKVFDTSCFSGEYITTGVSSKYLDNLISSR